MKIRLAPRCLLLVFCVFTIARSSGDENNTKGLVKSTKNNAEVQISISPVFKAGEPVELTVKVTNIGQNLLYYTRFNGVKELGILVADSKHNLVKLTDIGKSCILVEPKRQVLGELPPGESREYNVLLSNYFKLSEGKSLVSVAVAMWVRDQDSVRKTPFNAIVGPINFEIK